MSKKVWIDCDPGIDDTIALMYALNNPDLEVLGISITGGNVNANKGCENALALLKFLGIDVRVYIGEDRATFYATDTHGNNGLGNYPITRSEQIRFSNAALNLQEALRKYPNEVTVIALGPLSTLNIVFTDSYVDLVKEVVIMGGCYRSPGNCSPMVEFNFCTDSFSANRLFEKFSNCNKLKVVPLDITRKFVLTYKKLCELKLEAPKLGNFIEGITKYYFDFHKMQEGIDGCVINDVVAVYLASHNGFSIDSYVQVLSNECDIVDGIMVVDENNFYRHLPNAKIYLDCKIDDIWKDLFKALKTCENNLCNNE